MFAMDSAGRPCNGRTAQQHQQQPQNRQKLCDLKIKKTKLYVPTTSNVYYKASFFF